MPLSPQVEFSLWLAARPVAGAGFPAFAGEVAARLTRVLPVAGAVVAAVEPLAVASSDDEAAVLGGAQLRGGHSPLTAVAASGRALVVPDLTRVGPPALAAAAAGSQLLSAVTVPLLVERRAVGALQVFGTAERPVTDRLIAPLETIAPALGARLADLAAAAGREPAAVVEQAVGMLAERLRVDVDAARAHLAEYARQSGSDLAAAAEAVRTGTARPAAVPEQRTEADPIGRPSPRPRRNPVESTTDLIPVMRRRHRRAE